MNRRALFCLVLSALLAVLLSGCFGPKEGPKPAPPTKGPDPNKSMSSILSEIRIVPPSMRAEQVVIVSVGYYLGNNIPGGKHSLECLYPAQDGKAQLTESWEETTSEAVSVHSFLLQVDQPGVYAVTCQVDNQSVKTAEVQVVKNVQTDIQAEVLEIQVGRSSQTNRESFAVTVGYMYGSAATGSIACTYPSESGAPAQQVFPFTRPEPVEEYAGGRSQLLFNITVRQPGQYQVICRADPGGKEQSAGFEVTGEGEPAAAQPSGPDRVINANMAETFTGSKNAITLDTVVALTYSAKDGTLTGTLTGTGTEHWTGECKAGEKVIDHLIVDYVHNYQTVISTPLTPGQEISTAFTPTVHRSTKIVQDYTVCGGGSSGVSGPLEVDIPGSGTLTLLLEEDGSFHLSTHWDLFQYKGISGSVSGQAE